MSFLMMVLDSSLFHPRNLRTVLASFLEHLPFLLPRRFLRRFLLEIGPIRGSERYCQRVGRRDLGYLVVPCRVRVARVIDPGRQLVVRVYVGNRECAEHLRHRRKVLCRNDVDFEELERRLEGHCCSRGVV
ncbi:hypothetical protein MIMGU_mgv1a016217mg [Erythranthe guttata]|uniref:Uncharacterized protein n=1 Tax=Erythranthe guttata TaxID=4155 RepID=A0A022RGL7_ERYGU|nr:hypothetical protein MIMGU_mgv1a016217mg [Erythranthe guttata]